MAVSNSLSFTEVAYQTHSGGPLYYKSDYSEYSDDLEYVSTKGDLPLYPQTVHIPPITITHTQPYIEPATIELPRCEYCGRKQAKKDEPLCPGCGNVV